jgi:predicted phosphodiesterase
MRIRVLSDLHLEFHADDGREFCRAQADDGYDVMVLAGDINIQRNLPDMIHYFRDAAGPRPIVYVPGNHEYYGSTPSATAETLRKIGLNDPLLHILQEEAVTIAGRRFLGTTLWFPHSGGFEAGDEYLNDFTVIRGFRAWIRNKGSMCSQFLYDNVAKGDVVVTHHMPHQRSVHPRYKGDPFNRFFLHDVARVVEDREATLWIHGHTHDSMDYVAKGTRVVCNPMGYRGHGENSQFNYRLTVELPDV